MIGYVMVGTNNLEQSIKFYDKVLKIIGLERIETANEYAAYGHLENSGLIEFYVTKPFNKEKATNGNGTQISFITNSRTIVDEFHEMGLKAGGTSEGAGGERPEGSGVYYSYFRDLDNNKVCIYSEN